MNALTTTNTRGLKTRRVSWILMEIFSSHKGEQNAITQHELFRKVYQRKLVTTDVGDFARWEYIRRSLHYLRRKSNCFVISKRTGSDYVFFVPTTRRESQIYINQIENSVTAMRSSQSRCERSVREKWYLKQWELLDGTRSIKKIE